MVAWSDGRAASLEFAAAAAEACPKSAPRTTPAISGVASSLGCRDDSRSAASDAPAAVRADRGTLRRYLLGPWGDGSSRCARLSGASPSESSALYQGLAAIAFSLVGSKL